MEAALRGAPNSVGQHHCQEYKGHSGEPGPSLRVDHGLVGAADGGSHLYIRWRPSGWHNHRQDQPETQGGRPLKRGEAAIWKSRKGSPGIPTGRDMAPIMHE